MTVKNEILNICTLFSQQKSSEQTRISAVVENWTQKKQNIKIKIKKSKQKRIKKKKQS